MRNENEKSFLVADAELDFFAGGTLNKYYIFISLLSFPKNTVPFFYF